MDTDAAAQKSAVVTVPSLSAASRDSGFGSTSGPRNSESSAGIEDRGRVQLQLAHDRPHQREVRRDLANVGLRQAPGDARFNNLRP